MVLFFNSHPELVNSEGDESVFTHYDYVVIHVNDSGQIISWTKLFFKFLEGGGDNMVWKFSGILQ